jgi:hypothetical protein
MSKPNELEPTIKDPQDLTLADWQVIATVRGYKPSWIYESWAKAKGEEYLKGIDIDQWMAFAIFLGRSKTWAVERYDEYRNGATAEGEVA